MKFKIILSLVTLVILIGLYLRENIKDKTILEEGLVEGDKFIQGYSGLEAVEIEVNWYNEKSKKKTLTLVEKKDDAWYLVKPYFILVDTKKVETKVDNFLSLTSKEKVNWNGAANLTNAYKIKFKKENEAKTFSFLEKDFIEELDLALVEYEGSDFLIEKWFLFGLKFSPGELFNQNLFSINPLDITLVKTPDFTFVKTGKNWFLADETVEKKGLKQNLVDKIVVDLVFLTSSLVVLEENLKEEILNQNSNPAEKKFTIDFLEKNQIKKSIHFSIFFYLGQPYAWHNEVLYKLEESNYSFLDYTKEELYQ